MRSSCTRHCGHSPLRSSFYSPMRSSCHAASPRAAASPAAVSAGGAASCFEFTSETLRTAVTAWCAGDNTTYGHVSTWKTGGVTDMSALFAPSGVDITVAEGYYYVDLSLKSGACGNGDSNDFDGDISKWDGRSINLPPLLLDPVASHSR